LQVWWRWFEGNGRLGNVQSLAAGKLDGSALVEPMMHAGRRLHPPILNETRGNAARNLSASPGWLRQLEAAAGYPAPVTDEPVRLASEFDRPGGSEHR
jgi:hypothetical protein